MQGESSVIKRLIDLGFLIPINQSNLYHGRVRGVDETGEWQVDSSFNNGGNATGNRNIWAHSSLYAGKWELAKDFAYARIRQKGGSAKAEVHGIHSVDDGFALNANFDFSKLSQEDSKMMRIALKEMALFDSHYTALAPIDFEYREMARAVINELKEIEIKKHVVYYLPQDIEECCRNLSAKGVVYDRDLVNQLAESFNARSLVRDDPKYAVVRCFLRDNSSVLLNQNGDRANVNLEWIASWLSHNRIEGVAHSAYSATLGRHVPEQFTLFDLDKINTRKIVGDKIQAVMHEFGALANWLPGFCERKSFVDLFTTSTPEETMKVMNSNPKYKQYFDMPANVWEGFTVGEHTESVLRVFQDSFERDLPSSLSPFFKVMIISHDIGKGLAHKKDKIGQQAYTRMVCEGLHKDMGVTPKASELIQFLISDAQDYTTSYYVKRNTYALEKLRLATKEKLKELFGKEPPESIVRGVVGMAKVLQTCDSGAYTRYGVTRDKQDGFYYYNGNDRFTQGVKSPTDLAKRKQRLEPVLGDDEFIF